ncbi:MarR family transcriptional regulator [Ktedonobacter sp. SOSP1-85]|uniref:MarR family winged helix-turn-helix transcriptional regulator n=1 Tax=Ktedonobacter sp. SOSP1-85 TaxID=2778367 RepID=UPI001916223B|nr:MarR family transcriptional regulator [Ktedonobacter sp. SOSP1-85]GHO79163.1 MarR family transcriptional regulator [Ktedonobacter sp. SOSP1-85]
MPGSAVLTWLRLFRVFQRIDRAQTVHLRSWNLNVAQFDVLARVGARKGITQQELADSLLVTKGNISLLLNRMEEMGLLKRYQERRSNTLFLTAKGQELYDRVVPAHEELIARLMGGVSPSELRQLQHLLRKLEYTLR